MRAHADTGDIYHAARRRHAKRCAWSSSEMIRSMLASQVSRQYYGHALVSGGWAAHDDSCHGQHLTVADDRLDRFISIG